MALLHGSAHRGPSADGLHRLVDYHRTPVPTRTASLVGQLVGLVRGSRGAAQNFAELTSTTHFETRGLHHT